MDDWIVVGLMVLIVIVMSVFYASSAYLFMPYFDSQIYSISSFILPEQTAMKEWATASPIAIIDSGFDNESFYLTINNTMSTAGINKELKSRGLNATVQPYIMIDSFSMGGPESNGTVFKKYGYYFITTSTDDSAYINSEVHNRRFDPSYETTYKDPIKLEAGQTATVRFRFDNEKNPCLNATRGKKVQMKYVLFSYSMEILDATRVQEYYDFYGTYPDSISTISSEKQIGGMLVSQCKEINNSLNMMEHKMQTTSTKPTQTATPQPTTTKTYRESVPEGYTWDGDEAGREFINPTDDETISGIYHLRANVMNCFGVFCNGTPYYSLNSSIDAVYNVPGCISWECDNCSFRFQTITGRNDTLIADVTHENRSKTIEAYWDTTKISDGEYYLYAKCPITKGFFGGTGTKPLKIKIANSK